MNPTSPWRGTAEARKKEETPRRQEGEAVVPKRVIPAKAGTQFVKRRRVGVAPKTSFQRCERWVPAFAGMTHFFCAPSRATFSFVFFMRLW
jgi:hypothetical protein